MKIVFMGTPQAAVPSLERILMDGHEVVAVWTQPDRPAGRGNKLTASPVKQFALANNLIVHQPTKIKTDESLNLFSSHQAEVAVVVAYGRILPETFLQIFPKGAINVHFSLLPKYRGAAPVNWAIVHGEKTTGVTTMQMDAGLDTGDILLQSETEILANENAVDLMTTLSQTGAQLLSETLSKYESIVPIRQENSKATLAPMMEKADGLINWNLNAQAINNRIRGFQPFPTSYSFLQGKKITIWKAEAIFDREILDQFETGKVVQAKGENLIIACGEKSFLKINELQIEGKKRMDTRDFLNGIRIKQGEKLG